ncbi:MAG: thermonuclease family protein [Nitrosopumilus sp.]
MKPVIIIAVAVGISVVSVFVISEIIWYFANQEFEKVREELKESLVNIFEKQYEPISEQKESISQPTSQLDTQPSYSSQDCSGNARCLTGSVTQVIDGDTIKVDGQSIRFTLASAPELNEFNGPEARDFIENLCPVGSTALVDEDDGQTGGSYGRIIGVIYCNGVNLNEELLDSEFGYLSSGFCNRSEFKDEDWARKHGC